MKKANLLKEIFEQFAQTLDVSFVHEENRKSRIKYFEYGKTVCNTQEETSKSISGLTVEIVSSRIEG